MTTAALRAGRAIKSLAERTNAKEYAMQFFSTKAVFIRSKKARPLGLKLSDNVGMLFWSHINFCEKCAHRGPSAVLNIAFDLANGSLLGRKWSVVGGELEQSQHSQN
jgi:hypothetical protein